MAEKELLGSIANPIHRENILKGILKCFQGYDSLKREFDEARTPRSSYETYRALSQTLKQGRTALIARSQDQQLDFNNIPGESDSVICSSNGAAACEFFADAIAQGRLNYDDFIKGENQFRDRNDCVRWLRVFASINEWETYLLSLVAATINRPKDSLDEELPAETGEFIMEMLRPVDGLASNLAELNEQNPQLPESLRTEIGQDLIYLNERLNHFRKNYKTMTVIEAATILKELFVAVAGILAYLQAHLCSNTHTVATDMSRIKAQIITAMGPVDVPIYSKE